MKIRNERIKNGIYELKVDNSFVEITNKNGDVVYFETSDGFWYRKELDKKGNVVFRKDSNGKLLVREFDEDNKVIYCATEDGVKFDNVK